VPRPRFSGRGADFGRLAALPPTWVSSASTSPPGFWRRASAPLHLHGHTHGTVPGWRRRSDVCVDMWGWGPCAVEAIEARAAGNPDIDPRTMATFVGAEEAAPPPVRAA